MPAFFQIRTATIDDANALIELERSCFSSDRLSPRRIRHWLKASNGILLVAESSGGLVGYGLALLQAGTRLARLYSLAVAESGRGQGIGRALIEALEKKAAKRGRLFMRLEVAQDNTSAIRLYESLGYQVFGSYHDYYEDHRDALRMQNRIRYLPNESTSSLVPWFQQSTDFTCGPVALLMAMASLDINVTFSQEDELDIWREATTIFMTSGHGGCHPVGLALAAKARNFRAEVFVNREGPLFIDSVRSQHKKGVLAVVDRQFRSKAEASGVAIHYRDITQADLAYWLKAGAATLILISTYRMDGKKTPHWVTVTGIDDLCLYVHDPDPTEGLQTQLDCQHIPIARQDFEKMSAFGSERLRTAVVVWPATARRRARPLLRKH